MALPPPLWSDAFLEKDIRENPAYQALAAGDDGFDRFIAAARAALSSMQGIEADEQLTIERVITPILTALGWSTPLPKRRLTARDEIDLALYADDQARERALTLSPNEQASRRPASSKPSSGTPAWTPPAAALDRAKPPPSSCSATS